MEEEKLEITPEMANSFTENVEELTELEEMEEKADE